MNSVSARMQLCQRMMGSSSRDWSVGDELTLLLLWRVGECLQDSVRDSRLPESIIFDTEVVPKGWQVARCRIASADARPASEKCVVVVETNGPR